MTFSAAVTGMGAVTGHGLGCDGFWAAIRSGSTCIRPIDRFSTDGFKVPLGAQLDSRFFAGDSGTDGPALGLAMALAAALEAWNQAGLPMAGVAPERIAIVLGSGLGDDGEGLHRLTEKVADHLGIAGPRLTVSTACCSSTNALGIGRELLADGSADVVLAGGVDVLTPEVFAGFHALGVLNTGPCAPFSTSIGTTLGEGAGFVVLEHPEQAAERGFPVLGTLEGYGLSGDGFHETSPDPMGSGVGRAMAGALVDAGLAPQAIGYVNAHGSGTMANDPAEWRGIRKALGNHASTIPVSSLKGTIGHTQGAAGVLEAIATIFGIRNQVVVPTLNFVKPRPHGPSDPVGERVPRPHRHQHALSNNSAFGGCNAAIVLGDVPRPRTPVAPGAVYLLGCGAVGPFGIELADLSAAVRKGASLRGPAEGITLSDLVHSADPRGMDSSGHLLTGAAALAVMDAGIRINGDLRGQAGLLVGIVHPSPASVTAFAESIDERGLARLNPAAFARIVLNAAGGECSKLLALRGPNATVTTGAGSGLTAVVRAAGLVSTRADTELMVAGGVDEIPPRSWTRPGSGAETEGAACVVLGKRNCGQEGKWAVPVGGYSLGPPGVPAVAIDRAMEAAAASWADIDAVFTMGDRIPWADILPLAAGSATIHDLTPVLGSAPATGAVWAVIEAVAVLRRGEVNRILVVSQEGRSVSAALVLGPLEVLDGS